jgi:pimeloyl-ACP methyl ester carboxylesterase
LLADPLFEPARWRPEVMVALERMAGDYACGHWTGLVSNRWLTAGPAGRLAELLLPTRIVGGELDTPAFRAMAVEYAELLPNARRVTVVGAGHVCNLEAPAAFNEAVFRLVG